MDSQSVDLTRLQSQLASLEHHKAILTSQLLSLRSTHPLSSTLPDATPQSTTTATTSIGSDVASPAMPSGSNPPPSLDALTDSDILTRVFASSVDAHTSSLTRLYRMTGITTFSVIDPSPPHPTLLGIRFDVFSKRKFRTPHYILLSPATDGDSNSNNKSRLAIQRHSIPAFFNVRALHVRYCNDLAKFARLVRQKLQLHARRVDAVKELEGRALGAGKGIGDVTEPWTNRVESVTWDLAVEVVVITWGNGAKGWVVVDKKGMVGRVVVKDVKGRRKRDVERVIGDGDLSGIAERIGWV